MYQYPLELHHEATGVWLSCPDIPEMNASGDTLAEAFAEALDGFESALSLYVEQRRAIPRADLDVEAATGVVEPILAAVRDTGSVALRDLAERFDGVRPVHLRVPASALAAA